MYPFADLREERQDVPMALFAIGDLHLSFGTGKTMDRFGDIWISHEEKIENSFHRLIREDDTVVLTGDLCWGGHLSTCQKDIEFVESLPGRKIMLRGNHDVFWKGQQTKRLNDMFAGRLFFLQNNFCTYEDQSGRRAALVGSKGFCYEPWCPNSPTPENAQKRYEREAHRVEVSIEKARAAGCEEMILFLHYPPTERGEKESVFTEIIHKYGIREVVYSHLHGEENYGNSLQGTVDGVNYRLVSSDFLNFIPAKIRD